MNRRTLDFSKLTVLVVDDQEFIRRLQAQLLARLGITAILECRDGSSAIELLRETSADLVLCDIKMAPLDGLSFLRQVRSGESKVLNPEVPIIFLTSDSEGSTVSAARDSEVDGYLIKPVALDQLQAMIAGVMSRQKR
jgi:two-component system chemotaxis response regulator CheY